MSTIASAISEVRNGGPIPSLMLVVAVSPAPLAAARLCVKPGGGNGCQLIISLTLMAAQSGDTIRVAQGTYAEFVRLDKNFVLEGGGDVTFTTRPPSIYVSCSASATRVAMPEKFGVLPCAKCGYRGADLVRRDSDLALRLGLEFAAERLERIRFSLGSPVMLKSCVVLVQLFVRVLACAVSLTAFNSHAADFVMMTAPAPPVAGQPWSLAFAASTFGRDVNPATIPQVEVVGDRLRIRPRAECPPSCDVQSDNVFRVEMPALPAGRYTVEVVSGEDGDFAFARPFTVDVVAGPGPERLQPVDGFWSDPMRPGRGLALSLRGATLGIGVFDMQPRPAQFEPIWLLDAPILRGDSLVAASRRARTQLSDPSCLGCPATHAPEQLLSTFPFRLRFESERRARMDFGDGTTRPLVSLPFGAAYVSTPLIDAVDGEFGPLPLPDLQGRWVFDLPTGPQVVVFAAPRTDAGRVVFSSTTLELVCSNATPSQRAGCTLLGAGASPFARLGDVSETRMLFRPSGIGGQSYYAEKLPSR